MHYMHYSTDDCLLNLNQAFVQLKDN